MCGGKMEKVDIYDINKCKTGIVKIRGIDSLEKDEYVIISRCAIINNKKEILITKRNKNKKKHPSLWEIPGGHILTGETSEQGLEREIKEEIGLNIDKVKKYLINSIIIKNKINDVWVCKLDVDINKINFIDNEVEDAKFVSIYDYKKMHEKEELIRYESFSEDEYKKSIDLLF